MLICKLTIKEWEKYLGVKVIDPDGFDRTDPLLTSRMFTYDEFMKGLLSSTIKVDVGGLYYRDMVEDIELG
jgi:hypothetical protein